MIRTEEVEEKSREHVTKSFLYRGIIDLFAAKKLFKGNPYFLFPGVALAHHGIELLLKACCIWLNSKYDKTHVLVDLARSSFELDDKKEELLKKIDTYFFHRYPLDKKDWRGVEKVLKEIDENRFGIRSKEWDNIVSFYYYLSDKMPEDLRTIHNEVYKSVVALSSDE